MTAIRPHTRLCAALVLAATALNTGCAALAPAVAPHHHHAVPAAAEHEPAAASGTAVAHEPDHGHDHAAPAERRHDRHPDPRPGITADSVLDPAYVESRGYPDEAKVYAAVKAIPHIIDGLYCYCHCSQRSGHYSLLTCYHTGHAAGCDACLGAGELAARLHAEGKTLNEIRAAVDAQFGGGHGH